MAMKLSKYLKVAAMPSARDLVVGENPILKEYAGAKVFDLPWTEEYLDKFCQRYGKIFARHVVVTAITECAEITEKGIEPDYEAVVARLYKELDIELPDIDMEKVRSRVIQRQAELEVKAWRNE